MFDDLNDLYQQVILDHCKKPRNFHELPAATCSAQGNNPLCGDNYKVFAQVEAWADGTAAVDDSEDPAEVVYRQAAAIATLAERRRTVARLRGRGVTVIDVAPGRLASELADAYLLVKSSGRL